MVEPFSLCVGMVAGAIMGVLGMLFITVGEVTSLSEQNERLNRELNKLTDRDERGRFKGGK